MKVSEQTKAWCSKHKCKKSCQFLGGKCIAPTSDREFSAWVEMMNQEIGRACEVQQQC